MSTTSAPVSPVLAGLITSIREAVTAGGGDGVVAERVAAHVKPCLDHETFLTPAQREPDPTHYRQHVLHVEEDGSFSIVALVWLPGQETPIHDHVSWCVVGVHEGQEYETLYEVETDETGASWLVETGQSVNPPGSVAALTPPGDIHKVVNNGDKLAISLHVYGADIGKLGSSIRRRYDHPIR
jgi:predicted metal-dependent enzyme (double-stranded beta helix superfamily)